MKTYHHRVETISTGLTVYATDAPGPGGACHRYEIHGADITRNPSADPGDPPNFKRCFLLFQNGPIKEKGANGLTSEALLEIIADQLRAFQAGPYAHPANAQALTSIQEALDALNARTRERQARGVEGTSQV